MHVLLQKNSWSTAWGMAGYLMMAAHGNLCSIEGLNAIPL